MTDSATVSRSVWVDDPSVLVDSLVHEDGREFVFLVSEHAGPLTVSPVVSDGRLVTFAGGDASSVEMPPYGVTVLRGE